MGFRSFAHHSFYYQWITELKKKKKKRQWILPPLPSLSVGNPGIYPPSCIQTPFTDIHHSLNQHWGWERKSCHPTFHETQGAWVLRRSVGFRVNPHSWLCFFLAVYPLTGHRPSLSVGSFICKMGIIVFISRGCCEKWMEWYPEIPRHSAEHSRGLKMSPPPCVSFFSQSFSWTMSICVSLHVLNIHIVASMCIVSFEHVVVQAFCGGGVVKKLPKVSENHIHWRLYLISLVFFTLGFVSRAVLSIRPCGQSAQDLQGCLRTDLNKIKRLIIIMSK